MADTANDLLGPVLDKTADVIAGATKAGDPHGPTPCPEFDVTQLTEHLTGWAAKFASRLDGGEEPDEEGGAGTDPAEAFRASAVRIAQAYQTGGPASEQLPVGMLLMEFITHGWDLAEATGQSVPFTADEAAAALAAGQQLMTPEYRGPDKSFGAEVATDSTDTVDRLVAFLGRDPAWSPRP